jgi:putative copper export protein
MQKNVGRVDAWARAAAAIGLFAVAAVFNRYPVASLLAAVVALVLMGTALTGHCPLYRALGLDSCGSHSAPARK